MPNTTLPDITTSLDTVHGGSKAKAVVTGAKAAYNTVRPWIAKAGEAASTIGNLATGGIAAKEAWDYFRGGSKDAAPAAAPSAPPESAE